MKKVKCNSLAARWFSTISMLKVVFELVVNAKTCLFEYSEIQIPCCTCRIAALFFGLSLHVERLLSHTLIMVPQVAL